MFVCFYRQHCYLHFHLLPNQLALFCFCYKERKKKMQNQEGQLAADGQTEVTCEIEDWANFGGGDDDIMQQQQSSVPFVGDKAILLLLFCFLFSIPVLLVQLFCFSIEGYFG